MYKILVVDDEKIIRNGITQYITNADIGFTVTACAANGNEAIQLIKANDIDVLITDIKMPVLSGMELCKFVHENYPGIKVIILTGYKDFEYAKSAISYKVDYYLLKPTNPDEMIDILLRLRKSLENEAMYNKKISEYESLIATMEKEWAKDEDKFCDEDKEKINAIRNHIKQTRLIPFVEKSAEISSHSIIEKAKTYMKENFSSPISLQDIARQVYLNPSYFSRFFKKHTGVNVSDYLTELRIRHAILLLKENLSIEEISNRTGYTTSRYFVRTFKQYTGCTPKEYFRKNF